MRSTLRSMGSDSRPRMISIKWSRSSTCSGFPRKTVSSLYSLPLSDTATPEPSIRWRAIRSSVQPAKRI